MLFTNRKVCEKGTKRSNKMTRLCLRTLWGYTFFKCKTNEIRWNTKHHSSEYKFWKKTEHHTKCRDGLEWVNDIHLWYPHLSQTLLLVLYTTRKTRTHKTVLVRTDGCIIDSKVNGAEPKTTCWPVHHVKYRITEVL